MSDSPSIAIESTPSTPQVMFPWLWCGVLAGIPGAIWLWIALASRLFPQTYGSICDLVQFGLYSSYAMALGSIVLSCLLIFRAPTTIWGKLWDGLRWLFGAWCALAGLSAMFWSLPPAPRYWAFGYNMNGGMPPVGFAIGLVVVLLGQLALPKRVGHGIMLFTLLFGLALVRSLLDSNFLMLTCGIGGDMPYSFAMPRDMPFEPIPMP